MSKREEDRIAYSCLLGPVKGITEEAPEQYLAMTTTLDTGVAELPNIKKRLDKLLGTDRTAYIVDLDDAVNALRDIKTDIGKSGKAFNINKTWTATPARETKSLKLKGYLCKIGTVMNRRNRYTNTNSYARKNDYARKKEERHTPNQFGNRIESMCDGCQCKAHWKHDPECHMNNRNGRESDKRNQFTQQ